VNKAQALQQLYRLSQHSGIFDNDIKMAINFVILELSGQSGELPPKVKMALEKIESETNRMTQMRKEQGTLDIEEKVKT
jgi:hypothetical protein